MTKISFLIEDDFIEEFIQQLPKDKVTVIEEDFEDNKKLLKEVLEKYMKDKDGFISYNESMKNINEWFLKREEV